MKHCVWLLAVGLALPAYGGTAEDLAGRIREAGLDPEECYRVREINFSREDLRFYLTDGYLIFGRPVNGERISAVFTAEVEGGDAEILLLPPFRSERLSLATFTKSPNLNEHFRSALMLFTDGTGAALREQVLAGRVRKSLEMGMLLEDQWSSVVRNLATSFEIRLVLDLMSQRRSSLGMFYAALGGARPGNFDVVYDPRSREQIHVGRVSYRQDKAFFDTWASFPARRARRGGMEDADGDLTLQNIRIEATLHPDLRMEAVTRATLVAPPNPEQVLPFELSRRMRVTAATLDGVAAEVFHHESMRANLIRGKENEVFLVVAPKPLEPGRSYEIEWRHEGNVVSRAGERVFYVGSRATWYPQRGMQFAEYDIVFRYPSHLNLVFPGEIVEDRQEGEWRITRRKTPPIRLAGFNLGDYEKTRVSRGGYSVEAYANRKVESALLPKTREFIVVPPPSTPWSRRDRRPPEMVAMPAPMPAPDPTARLQPLASEIASALEWMASHFGPPPMKTLAVSPVPGTFGQGFPGMIYLSTLAYLDPKDRPASARNESHQLFFSEILHGHEAAHQWWGNVVTSASYKDDWLMEALANYSALLLLEKKKGPRAIETVLEEYKAHLLAKNEQGATLESAGPITWGVRLDSSQAPGAWRAITYEKGSWIMHMLRRRMGDARFLSLLGELCKRFRHQPVSTEDFRLLASGFQPPDAGDRKLENFFENWVYGTGIPTLQVSWKVHGKAPNLRLEGSVKQSGVDANFTTEVPVEIQVARGKPVVRWVRTSDEPVPFRLSLRQAPVKVLLDPGASVLAVRQ